jgi:hypothetical protein
MTAPVSRAPLLGVITNPNSRKNRLRPERYEWMRERVGDIGLVRRTADTSEIADVVREFMGHGVQYWLADGGDGAFHWLVNQAVAALRARDGTGAPGMQPILMPTNAGTIDFIGKKAGVIGPADDVLGALVDLLRQGKRPDTILLDTLEITGIHGPDSDAPGKVFHKLGFAAALAGIGQRFFDKWYAHDRQNALGIAQIVTKVLTSGFAASPGLRALPWPSGVRYYAEPIFEPMPLHVWIDGEEVPIQSFRDLSVGSINIDLAGVFRFFPYAAQAGVLHAQCGDPSPAQIVRNLPNMMTGRELHMPRYVQKPANHVRVVCRDGRCMDPVIDGELYWGVSELDVRLGPAIEVVTLQV